MGELPEGSLLDVGCGYGPVGLALAYASQRPVEMIDINQRAVDLAKGNAQRNGIEQVDIHQSNIYAQLNQPAYAAILSNPPIRAGKEVVHEILTGAFPCLKQADFNDRDPKETRAPSAQKKMQETLAMPKSSKRQRLLHHSKRKEA